MFLIIKKKKINSNRHRKYLNWHFFKNNIKKYKKLKILNCNNKLVMYYFNKICSNLTSNLAFNFIDIKKNNIYRPLSYGFLLGSIHYNNIYINFLNKNNSFNLNYLVFLKEGSLFFFLEKNNSIFIKSKGTYGVIIRHDFIKNKTLVKLPSNKLKFFSSFSTCIFGRNYDIFYKYIVLGSWGFAKKLIKNKKVSVRGIAMNPVDHPNGGRTKTKKPFKNKFFKIAKKNK